MAQISNLQRWRCIDLDIGGLESANLSSIASTDAGLWAIAENVQEDDNSAAQGLLDHITQQVSSGEDLTAAFLNAHARHQRENPESKGARVIAIRHARTAGTLELAWVGHMHALLLRGAQAIALMSERPADTGSSGYLVPTERVQQLGTQTKQRPRIDRNLVQAQKGDFLLLASSQISLKAQANELAGNLKGFGNLQYKARKLQSLMNENGAASGRFILCQVG